MSLSSATPPSSSFWAEELQRALAEQSFGIRVYSIVATSPLRATASVTLHEGHSIFILLTNRGYTIETMAPSKKESETFETLENLLHTISPIYEQQRRELLVRKLERL